MFELDIYGTLVAASGVLLLGQLMLKRIPLLAAYTIPEPVAGGLLAALLLLVARSAFGFQVQFDNSLAAPLMLTFFACIGLNADLASLRQGGRPLMIFLAVVLGFLVLQNVAGLLLASALGQSPFFGLLAGSIALSGGHGTGVAWGKVFAETHGIASATEIALACATFGLVLGGVIGGPVAKFLLRRVELPDARSKDSTAESSFEKPNQVRLITAPALIETLALISICLLGGQAVAKMLAGSLLELPAFVCVLFIGVILRNSLSAMGFYTVFERAVSVLGNVSLALFLAMARHHADADAGGDHAADGIEAAHLDAHVEPAAEARGVVHHEGVDGAAGVQADEGFAEHVGEGDGRARPAGGRRDDQHQPVAPVGQGFQAGQPPSAATTPISTCPAATA
jgi:ESS family glutamate:Na+ symporter